MQRRLPSALALPSLFAITGCGAIGKTLLIPVAVVAVVFGGLAGIFIGSGAAAEEDELWASGVRVEQRRLDVELDRDQSFRGTLVEVVRVTGADGLERAQQVSLAYDPRIQELELVSAHVEHPDGTIVEVDGDHVFERPSAAERGAPGFVSGVTKSVLFPQLTVGSRTHVEWRFREGIAPELGFHYEWRPPFALPVDEARIRIAYDPEAPLRFDAEAPFVLTRSNEGGRDVVEAVLTGYAGQTPEAAMVSPRDVCPRFVASSVMSWEAIGDAFREAAAPSIQSSPEIDGLAAEIVGDREGLEAVRAIHRWVCTNIHYVPVHLRPSDGWVPHAATEVLANGYGDCKDKVAIMASLLGARGIAAEPVLVKQDRGFVPFALPTPSQFDHCMLFVPEFDVYSNPTDPLLDLGDLDNTLSDKFVGIAGTPSRVARTPAGSPDDNAYSASHTVALAADGWLTGTSVIELEGRTEGRIRRRIVESSAEGLDGATLLRTDVLGGFGSLETTDPLDLDTPLRCEGTWTSDVPVAMGATVHFATPSGIDFANAPFLREFLSAGERRYPALVAATDIRWSLRVELPEGYEFLEPPEDQVVVTDMGRFSSSHRVDEEGRLVVQRSLRVERDRVAPEEYDEIRRLLLATVADMGVILSARRIDG